MKKLSNSKTELKKSIVYKNKACSQILLLLLLLCEEIPQVYYKRNKLMNKIDWLKIVALTAWFPWVIESGSICCANQLAGFYMSACKSIDWFLYEGMQINWLVSIWGHANQLTGFYMRACKSIGWFLYEGMQINWLVSIWGQHWHLMG